METLFLFLAFWLCRFAPVHQRGRTLHGYTLCDLFSRELFCLTFRWRLSNHQPALLYFVNSPISSFQSSGKDFHPIRHTRPNGGAHPRLHDRESLTHAHNIYIGIVSHTLVSVEGMLSGRRGWSGSPWSSAGGNREGEPQRMSQRNLKRTHQIVRTRAIAQSSSVLQSTNGGGIRSTTMTAPKQGHPRLAWRRGRGG
jgi:hypothetical protein